MTKHRLEISDFHRSGVVVGKAVDADDLGSLRQQPVSERGSDEPGDAGDKGLHSVTARLHRMSTAEVADGAEEKR